MDGNADGRCTTQDKFHFRGCRTLSMDGILLFRAFYRVLDISNKFEISAPSKTQLIRTRYAQTKTQLK